jgi:hypothetical protein
VDKSTIGTSDDQKILGPKKVLSTPYRTAKVNNGQAAKQPPYRTVADTSMTHNYEQLPTNHNPVQSTPSPPAQASDNTMIKVLVGLVSISGLFTLVYMSLHFGIWFQEKVDNIPVTPYPRPRVNNFTTSYERMRRSSPITAIGFDSAKVRDPTRWSLSTEDIGNIARLQPPEGTTTVTLQFVGSITVFEQSQSLGATEAQMINAMKYLVRHFGEEDECNK